MTKSITVCTVLVEKSPQALPLGAACIASYLKGALNKNKEQESIKVNLLDFNLEEGATSESVAQELEKTKSEIFLFSVYVWNRKLLCKTALLLKEKFPSAICIAGGPEVTARPESFFPEETFGTEPFDYVISGEGEEISAKLISDLLQGKTSEKILYGKRSVLANLSSPYLDGTLNAAKYEGALWELARGCPFKCSYCYESKGEKTVDYFPLERLKAELDYFHQNNIPQIWVLDPTYNAKKERAIEMLNYMAKKAPEIFFHFECRAEFLDRELVKAFTKVNCCMQIGLQSADENVLKLVHRGFNKKEFIKKVAILNETGITFGFDLIYGLPGDTLSGFEQSIDFALSLYPNHLELFCLSVLPGTDLYDRRKELHLDFEETAPYHVLSTDKFSAQDLAKAARLSKACNLFYSQGRAVPWFNSVLHLIKINASSFFKNFADFLDSTGNAKCTDQNFSHKMVENLQIDFIKIFLKNRNKDKYFDLISDIIKINGAFSRLSGEAEESTINLHYHPEDLLSEYAQDLQFFQNNAQKKNYRVRVFNSKRGPDFKIL